MTCTLQAYEFRRDKRPGDIAGHDKQYRVFRELQSIAVCQVTCGMAHTVLLSTEGSVWAWGANHHGQCGVVSSKSVVHTPTQVWQHPNFQPQCVTITSGYWHVLAVTATNDVYAWGDNRCGQLGITTKGSPKANAPIRLEPFTTNCIIQLSAGASHSMALSIMNEVFVWGAGQNGQVR